MWVITKTDETGVKLYYTGNGWTLDKRNAMLTYTRRYILFGTQRYERWDDSQMKSDEEESVFQ